MKNIESISHNVCTGCEACSQICGHVAITMCEDVEGFRYPTIDHDKCTSCGLCLSVCPTENPINRNKEQQTAFGGYTLDGETRESSTSGGAFSAIVEAWADENYVIFGAETNGLEVRHSYITDKTQINRFRKSKYTQSRIGSCYKDVKDFLRQNKKVLFSGTPCQIAGLRAYLGKTDQQRLLTVEVVCEGVPSPHYIHRLQEHIEKKHKCKLLSIDYRYKDDKRWDFQVMLLSITSKSPKNRIFKRDRWFNPFWRIWLSHLMSRPSCYGCTYANRERVADISLGDLWGVHLYCPDLYGHNGGASLVVCNTDKGRKALDDARRLMYGRDLNIEDAIRYQSPMRQPIAMNPRREEFMDDVMVMDYRTLVKKWGGRPSLRLLFSKYVWGNRQKVWLWNIKQRLGINENK